MAAGDWATGTKAVILDAQLTFDGTAANTPVRVIAHYRIVLPSGEQLDMIRSVDFVPTSDDLTNLAAGLTTLAARVQAQEGF